MPAMSNGKALWAALFSALILGGGCRSGQGDKVLVKGIATSPLEEVYVHVYKEDMDIYGPAFATAGPTSADGSFSISLPPGRYIFVARKRISGDAGGPVLSGDYRSKPIGPLEVKPGRPAELSVLVERKEGESKSLPAAAQTNWNTGISGRILDGDGKPVPKARVHVYTYVQMSERPKYVSNETGPDGKYSVTFPEGGTYYLAARDKFGGPPKLGDLYGRYDDGTIDPSGIVVKTNEMLKDIDITVHKVW